MRAKGGRFMRITDAFSAMKAGKNKTKQTKKERLCTVWSEQGHQKDVPAEYPRPQFRRDNWACLNGFWKYAVTKSGSHPEKFDGQILVPFSPECSRSGVERRLEPGEYLWYFRTISLTEIPAGKRLFLHFGAVDERCIVWWNGKLLGSHQNGYLAFSFDVTELIREGTNTLWVRVQDDTDSGGQCRGKQTLQPGGMFYTAQSGIWQTVWMEWVPEHYIEKLKITPLYDEDSVRMEIRLTKPADIKIRITGDDTLAQDAFDFSVLRREADFRSDGFLVLEVILPDFQPWSPEEPYLYKVEITAGDDHVESYFAMRKFSAGMDKDGHHRLMLNNKPYFFNGVLDQGYWPESLYTAPCDEAMISDIQNMKELGFNMLRKHIKIEPMRWYYHCDRLGMAVWQDMVNGGGRLNMPFVCYLPTVFPAVTAGIKDNRYRLFSRSEKDERKRWEEDCMATVDQLYNCPCIGMWIPFNEGWGQFDALRIAGRIKAADAGRLVDHASGWFDQGGGDVKSVHNYFRPLKVKKDCRPFVISEYGGYSCPVPEHLYSEASYGYHSFKMPEEFSAAFWKLQQKIQKLRKKGLAAAVYTQVSDVEDENNGLYTYDRKICKIQNVQSEQKFRGNQQ